MAKKTSARSKGYRKYTKQKETLNANQWKKILIGIAAALAVIVLVILLYDDGSLKTKDGKVIVDGENPLVVNVNENSNPHYFKIAEVSKPIDGFTKTSSEAVVDSNTQVHYYEPDDKENCPITRYGINACRGLYTEVPYDTRPRIEAYMLDCIMGDDVKIIEEANLAYYSYVYSRKAADSDETVGYTQAATAYLDSGRKDSCILISLYRYMDTPDDIIDNETIEKYLMEIIPTITLEEK